MGEQLVDLDDIDLSELLDRIAGKIGANNIHRYVPDEHYWPERSFKPAASINEKLQDSLENRQAKAFTNVIKTTAN